MLERCNYPWAVVSIIEQSIGGSGGPRAVNYIEASTPLFQKGIAWRDSAVIFHKPIKCCRAGAVYR
jgi:hypothetical protein